MDMGVCCITAESGGEEPPGGKKTWTMAPGGIQGLVLAIHSPVCWPPEALNIHTSEHKPRCSLAFPRSPRSFKLPQWTREGCIH